MSTEAKWSDFSSLDGERTLAAVNLLLPRWVTLALVAAIAWQLARVIWLLMPGSSAADQIVAPAGQRLTPAALASNQLDVQSIATAHIFGHADAGPVIETPRQSYEDLSETRLSLSLKGTMANTDEKSSIAIIADHRDQEKNYFIGDTVTAGATLHAVYADRVVLNRSGTLEVLKLPKDFPKGTRQVRRNATTVSRTAANPRSIQNVVTQNVTRLADVIRPTPYYVSGQMQGYRVYPGRDRKQFAALGLRPGDLIKDIDGAALTNPQQAMQIFQNLGNAEQVSVTVERNGQPQVLVLRTSQLNLDENR
ncbi:MAG: type II secretion system protein GspC [Gammaproteobacteria bacterium]|nr:MAG: type II secretion system protein GspC [Gammaproteobacteria bacterium]